MKTERTENEILAGIDFTDPMEMVLRSDRFFSAYNAVIIEAIQKQPGTRNPYSQGLVEAVDFACGRLGTLFPELGRRFEEGEVDPRFENKTLHRYNQAATFAHSAINFATWSEADK